MCGHGHRPVGLAEIWLNMKKPGVVQFDVKIDCYNPNCSHDPSTCVLTAVNDAKRTMNIKATPCCDKPQLMLVSLKAKYVPFGSTLQLPVDVLHFSHDSIHQHFRDGHSVVETAQKIIKDEMSIDALPKSEVTCRDNRWYSLSNRRLQVFKQVAKARSDRKWNVTVINTQMIPKLQKKFTTHNEGRRVEWN